MEQEEALGLDCGTIFGLIVFSFLSWFGFITGILFLDNESCQFLLQGCAITIILIVLVKEALQLSTYGILYSRNSHPNTNRNTNTYE